MLLHGANKGQFVFGRHASFDEEAMTARILEFEKQGFMVLFTNLDIYCRTMVFKIEIAERQEFIDAVFKTASEINCKKEVLLYIHSILEDLHWK